MQKKLILFFILGAFGCTRDTNEGAATIEAQKSKVLVVTCPVYVVAWPSIAGLSYQPPTGELNRVYNCRAGRIAGCTFDPKYNVTLQKGYNSGWLWTDISTTYPCSIAGQNSIIAQASQWAFASTPKCSNGSYMDLISITFFRDEITAINNNAPPGYCVGCNALYGCCIPTGKPK